MAFTHTNRRGDAYYLQCSRTRTGKDSYSFTPKTPKNPIEEIPEGFEVYEDPATAIVYLRRIKPSPLLPTEREQVADAVRNRAGLEHFLIQIEEESLVVYLPGTEPEEADRTLDELLAPGRDRKSARDWLMQQAPYLKMLRFILVEEKPRLFRTQRWCFRGCIDNWLDLPGQASLSKQLARYVPHLGKPSFYELY